MSNIQFTQATPEDIEAELTKQVMSKLSGTSFQVQCPKCGHDITVSSGSNVCPLCGAVLSLDLIVQGKR